MGLFTTNFSSFYKEFVEKPADTEEISQAKNSKDNVIEKKKIEPENQKPTPTLMATQNTPPMATSKYPTQQGSFSIRDC